MDPTEAAKLLVNSILVTRADIVLAKRFSLGSNENQTRALSREWLRENGEADHHVVLPLYEEDPTAGIKAEARRISLKLALGHAVNEVSVHGFPQARDAAGIDSRAGTLI
jgi:hypothetical protein